MTRDKRVARVSSLALAFLWLLVASRSGAADALDWQNHAGHRSAALRVSPGGRSGFTLMPASATGIDFTNVLPQVRHLTNQVLLNGAGVAAGDVDGDGWCDLYFCGLDRSNVLYHNLGNGKFADHTAVAGVACAGLTSSGCALADLEGDGDLDLFVNTVGKGTHVFVNDGKGHFAGLAVLNAGKGGTSLALGDLDGDGFLDLYVANYRTQGLMDMPNTRFNFATVNGQKVIARVNGRPVTDPDIANRYRLNSRGGIEENGEVDEIYRNVGGRRFAPLSFTDGTFLDEDGRALTSPPYDWGLSVMIRDLNQDGRPDIWVCNDFDAPERLWLNQGQGKFRAAPRLALRKTSHFSMGIDVADLNRDGLDDIFVADMLSPDHVMRMDMQGDRNPPVPRVGVFDDRPDYMMNTLFLNRGDGTYAEIAQLAGVAATDWTWAVAFLDVDLDGYEDLLVANGHERAARSLDIAERLQAWRAGRNLTAQEIFENRKIFPRQNSANLAFRNRGDLTFQETGKAWGFDFNGVSHGMALADLDNDGDLEVVVNNLNDPAGIHRNNSSAPRLGVRLRGAPPNTRGIGAKIKVLGGAVPMQSQEMVCGGRYLSSDEPLRVFAAGSLTNEMTIEVTWGSGQRSVVTRAKANHAYEIEETGTRNPEPETRNPVPWFADVSPLLAHSHHDDPFDDFARQALLPNKLSQAGPGVTWADVNGDGWEDLLIPSGKGGALALFHNNGQGGFARVQGPFSATAVRDQTAVLPWRTGAGMLLLLTGQASDELAADGPCARAWPVTGQPLPDVFPALGASAGPMALADVDGDGSVDLFVGGRFVPGRYPEAGPSALFRGNAGGFQLDEINSRALAGAGLVSGAVFTDLDADGDPDLVLAGEWGPLKILRNEIGKLVAWDPPIILPAKLLALSQLETRNSKLETLSKLAGWWTGVTTGDFNGDGRLDIVAGNWGRNTRFEAHRNHPLELLHGDFNDDGIVEMIETYHDATLQKRVTERAFEFIARGMPSLRETFTSHQAFGRSSVEELLGERAKKARRLHVNFLESALFLNGGETFSVHPLPVEAQMAPAFGVCAGDFDGDGHEDVFLSQNFFAVPPETPRYDAGRGLWLRGDGQGGFGAVPGKESGVLIYGEQRGAAVADFDHDGRLDLAVAQNGAATKLFRNVGARPGLRVRLLGAPGNPDAIGAVIRLVSGGQSGPAREIHAGSGYWSQDGVVPVMSSVKPATQVSVRWPGGKSVTGEIPPGASTITVDVSGLVKGMK